MTNYDLKTEKAKLKTYLADWDVIIEADFKLPLTASFEQNFFADCYHGFIYRAHQYVVASLKSKNTHSLAALCRTNIELTSRQELIMNVLLTTDDEDLMENLNLLGNDLIQTITRNMKNNRTESENIAAQREAFQHKPLSLVKNHENRTQILKRLQSKNNRYQNTPNLGISDRRAKKFANKLKGRNVYEDLSLYHKKISRDVQDHYRHLSETFFHPSAATLRKHHWQGAIYDNDRSDNALIYNLLLLNSTLKWNNSTAGALQKISKSFELKSEHEPEPRQKDCKSLSIDPQVESRLSDLDAIIYQYLNYYKEKIVYFDFVNANPMALQLNEIHKFYIHSSAAALHSHHINIDAYCIELSIMSKMLDEIYDAPETAPLDKNFINNFKHPLFNHFRFMVSQGGIQFDSLNQKASLLILHCLFRHLIYWQQLMRILMEKANEEHKNELIKKAYNLAERAQRLTPEATKIFKKYAYTR